MGVKVARDFMTRPPTEVATVADVEAFQKSPATSHPVQYNIEEATLRAKPYFGGEWCKSSYNQAIVDHLVKEAIGEDGDIKWLNMKFWELISTARQNYQLAQPRFQLHTGRLENLDERDERVNDHVDRTLARGCATTSRHRVSCFPSSPGTNCFSYGVPETRRAQARRQEYARPLH